MSEVRPLPIYWGREPTDADFGRIRAAKQRLNLPFLVQFGRAVAEGHERVLAIGGKPDFLCDYAGVPSTWSKGLDEALAWVLGEHEDSRATMMADMLSEWMGGKVVELAPVELGGSGNDESAGRGGQRGGGDPKLHRSSNDYGRRGEIDPGISDERDYRRALRETVQGAAQVGQ